ncbi:MAG: Gx transporter family protein [Clostridia bacterium]|nr:Gx transporter family protein [Clostridia bacterium]
MKNAAKKTAFLGLCTALALVLAYVESLLPPLSAAIPGIKMGLPNIVIIFMLYRFGLKDAAIVSFVRVVAVVLLFGNMMGFAYSMAGAVLSLLGMLLLKKLDFFSVVGVSVAGGVLHNVGQILMAMFLLRTAELGYYLVVLAVTGTVSGVLIGICGYVMIKRIPEWK